MTLDQTDQPGFMQLHETAIAPETIDLTDSQAAVLAAIGRGENPPINAMMRRAFKARRLITAIDPPRAPRNTPGRKRAPAPRRHALTDSGRAALARRGDGQ